MTLIARFLRLLTARALAWLLAFTAPFAALAAPGFETVVPGKPLQFPHDFGAHPGFRTEWWYATGWLKGPDGQDFGFQVTFFRAATGHDRANPSRFAPHQIIIAHAALADARHGRLLHDQKRARAGFDLAYAREGDTDVKLHDWHFRRKQDDSYHTRVSARDFALDLSLSPSQALMVQGEQGYSRKGPRPGQASHYYSRPHLRVQGSVVREGKTLAVEGEAWLDHEWSTTVLDEQAAGWDWIGINLADGGALVAFRIRARGGGDIWAYAALRAPEGTVEHFGPDQVRFAVRRRWRSPRTDAEYPVAVTVTAGTRQWELEPLMDDQELDSRSSTGAVYWEGAVRALQDGKEVGRGYLELTGYVSPMKL